MTRSELIGRLKKYEWSDVEFKEARNAAPKAAYETVSAFANTAGGWLCVRRWRPRRHTRSRRRRAG